MMLLQVPDLARCSGIRLVSDGVRQVLDDDRIAFVERPPYPGRTSALPSSVRPSFAVNRYLTSCREGEGRLRP